MDYAGLEMFRDDLRQREMWSGRRGGPQRYRQSDTTRYLWLLELLRGCWFVDHVRFIHD